MFLQKSHDSSFWKIMNLRISKMASSLVYLMLISEWQRISTPKSSHPKDFFLSVSEPPYKHSLAQAAGVIHPIQNPRVCLGNFGF